jgi:uncharacterized protein YlbG (UPF0298 family)
MLLYNTHKCKSMKEETHLQTDGQIHIYKNRDCRFKILYNKDLSRILNYKFIFPFFYLFRLQKKSSI